METSFKTVVVIFVVESVEKAEDNNRGACFSKGLVTFWGSKANFEINTEYN